MSPSRFFAAFAIATCCLAQAAGPQSHNYDLKHVLWRLSFDEERGSIAGESTNILTPVGQPIQSLFIHCSKLNVSAVTVNGKKAASKLDGDRLWITLPRPFKPGETLRVKTVYTGTPENGIYFVSPQAAYPATTGMVYTQGEAEDTRCWLPTYDLPDDKATSEGFIEVPKGYAVMSNGRLIGVEGRGATRTFHWRMDQPHSTYLISLVAGPFSIVTKKADDVPVSYYVPPGLEKEGEASFGQTPEMLRFYAKLLAFRYPFVKYAQAAVGDFVVGGMENVTAVSQTIRTLHPAETEPVEDSSNLVAHELAHSWFGNTVTCRSWQHLWLNEGFATFLPCFWTREKRGDDEYDIGRYELMVAAQSVFKEGMAAPNVPPADDPIGRALGSPYSGAAARLFMLMDQVGEPAFWAGAHDFLDRYKFQSATTDEFFESMAKSTGQDLTPFMRQWFYTPSLPNVQVSRDGDSIVLRQKRPYFSLTVPVWVLDDDSWIKKDVRLDGAEAKLPIEELGDRPVLVDPEARLLVTWGARLPLASDQILRVYRNLASGGGRARLIDTYFSRLDEDSALEMLHGEKNALLIARMVARIRPSEAAAEALIGLLKHDDKRAAFAAASMLGYMPQGNGVSDALRAAFETDSNYIVRQAALGSLLRLTGDKQLADRAWGMGSFNEGFRDRVLAWWTVTDPNLARKVSLELLSISTPEPLRIAAIETLGTVKDSAGEPLGYEALCAVLRERSFRARLAAVRALGAYGNAAAIPLLQPLATQHFLAPAVSAAIGQLRGGRVYRGTGGGESR